MPYARGVASSPSSRSRRRSNPWLRLLVPIALVVLATLAIWGPKLGWFDFSGDSESSNSEPAPVSSAAAESGTSSGTNSTSAPARPAEAVPVTVDYVHDGDTLFVYPDESTAVLGSTDKTKVRLLGIDTPEIGDNSECFGAEATDALRALLPEGSTAWALTDVNPTDKYGRSLLLLWTEDGRFVNNEMLASGAATVLQINPNRAHTELFRQSEAAAAASGAGLWGAC